MAYKFVDTNVSKEIFNFSSIQTIIDNINLDVKYKGYFRTLQVNGRNDTARSLETLSFSSANYGGRKRNNIKSYGLSNRFISSSLAGRKLEVLFLLKASDNSEYRKISSRVLADINKEEVSIKFSDDFNYSYTGTITGVEFGEEITNEQVGKIVIDLIDPFKYSEIKRKVISDTFDVETLYPVDVSKIEFVASQGNWAFKNITKGLSINIDYLKNTNLVIITKDSIIQNGISLMPYLDLNSDYEEIFSLDYMDKLGGTNISNIVIFYRERLL